MYSRGVISRWCVRLGNAFWGSGNYDRLDEQKLFRKINKTEQLTVKDVCLCHRFVNTWQYGDDIDHKRRKKA